MHVLALARNRLKEKLTQTNATFLLDIKIETLAHAPQSAVITLREKNNLQSETIAIEKAVDSALQKQMNLTNKQLHNGVILHAPSNATSTLLPLLSYFALRHARIWRCQNVILQNDQSETNPVLCQLLSLEPLNHCPGIFAQRLEYAIHLAYEKCDDAQKQFIQLYFINEILDSFEMWVTELFHGSFFSAIHTQTISKEQYIASLFNLHQFVKHTTRLAARCVALCENRELRNHYIHHLKGEINHEVIIESDLKALRADVDYLLRAHVPHTATAEFIVLQESITGYKRDAVLMLACPFIAEGMTANIGSDFVENLFDSIRGWGIKSPESVSRFLTSHMKTDGGDDGHWIRVIMMINMFIQSENQMQEFLNVLRLAMSSYAHGLNANIDDLELWRKDAAVAVLV